jgi:hypothetical protein
VARAIRATQYGGKSNAIILIFDETNILQVELNINALTSPTERLLEIIRRTEGLPLKGAFVTAIQLSCALGHQPF